MDTETSETSLALKAAFGSTVVTISGNSSLEDMVASATVSATAREERARFAPRVLLCCRHANPSMLTPLLPEILEALRVERILPGEAIARAVAQRSATGLALEALEAVGGSVPESLEAAALAQDLSMRPGWALMQYPHNPAALEAFQGLEELTGRPTRVVVIDFPAAATMNPPSPHGGAPSTVLVTAREANDQAALVGGAYPGLVVSVQYAGKSVGELVEEISDAVLTGEAMPYEERSVGGVGACLTVRVNPNPNAL